MAGKPLILGIDTALGATSIALLEGASALTSFRQEYRGDQAARLLSWIEAVLADAGKAYGDLDAFAVTTGPGGFTSIRIGLAAVRALALATGKPALGFSTLEILAAGAAERLRPGDRCLTVLPGGREQYFAQVFVRKEDGVQPAGEAMLADSGTLARLLPEVTRIVTTLDPVPPWLNGKPVHAHAVAENAAIAARLALGGDWRHAPLPAPLYIRPPDAAIPKPFGHE